ncbi:hypothetical protein JAAARDRAFT_198760 [Jaapia argillacea MUCL 33604]|uniref:Uncharacterized protein n=1 Tax=Jaapia argillacea MUCL 33604 TaxID=933084 RepID=A0A067PDH8_9AGAM|nr:hypothetical protein JAAARDRAFT_198760 [Jaapia argillacea MUCL 33604]
MGRPTAPSSPSPSSPDEDRNFRYTPSPHVLPASPSPTWHLPDHIPVEDAEAAFILINLRRNRETPPIRGTANVVTPMTPTTLGRMSSSNTPVPSGAFRELGGMATQPNNPSHRGPPTPISPFRYIPFAKEVGQPRNAAGTVPQAGPENYQTSLMCSSAQDVISLGRESSSDSQVDDPSDFSLLDDYTKADRDEELAPSMFKKSDANSPRPSGRTGKSKVTEKSQGPLPPAFPPTPQQKKAVETAYVYERLPEWDEEDDPSPASDSDDDDYRPPGSKVPVKKKGGKGKPKLGKSKTTK